MYGRGIVIALILGATPRDFSASESFYTEQPALPEPQKGRAQPSSLPSLCGAFDFTKKRRGKCE